MQPTSNHLLLKAINKEPIDRTPLWIMRQAGRYLPEYMDLKNKSGGFINLVKNPELACEITMQPLKRFSLDSAILFSDILIISDMFGIELSFEDNKGPKFDKTIRNDKDLSTIVQDYDVNQVRYVFDTINRIKSELNNEVPLIGFIGSPWTVATYFIEGNSTKNFNNVKKLISTDEKFLSNLLDEITKASIKYIHQQIISGVDVVMIFDTWGGLLQGDKYLDLSIKYVNKIKDAIKNKGVPIIYYIREPREKISYIKDLEVDVIGIDSSIGLGEFRRAVGDKFAVQGNFDKDILKLDDAAIYDSVDSLLNEYGFSSGHIFNLGVGITPDIDPEKVKTLVDAVRELSPSYNKR